MNPSRVLVRSLICAGTPSASAAPERVVERVTYPGRVAEMVAIEASPFANPTTRYAPLPSSMTAPTVVETE